ncbi:MAG TPA: SulP family inorganic anion transporter [Candidatus Limnocylindrales bacterium]
MTKAQPKAGTPRSRSAIARRLPGLATARSYQPAWLAGDLVAGLVLTAVLVPVGMGYAEASGLPAIYGLYATMIPLVAYAIFGPSRILVLGPDSSLAALIAATILPLAGGDTATAVALAGGLAVVAGLMSLGAGLAKLGFITDLLSTPIRYGYLNGIALTVLVGQLPKLFGFSTDADGLVDEVRAFVQGVADGLTNPVDLAIGTISILIILGCKRLLPKVPGVLIAVVATTVFVAVTGAVSTWSVATVGPLPQGLPHPALPALPLGDLVVMITGGAAIALVSMADTSVLSRILAGRAGTRPDPDQELVALGVANIATGFVQGFPISSSGSRTPVAEQAGARTQLTGVVGAGAIAIMLVFVPGITTNLPTAALAAVVITACLSLVEVRGLVRLWRIRPSEFLISMICFLGVAVIGVVPGIFFSVGVAILAFLWRAWRPYSAVLGRVEGMKGYHDTDRHPEARQIPGLILFRWDAPLFFANAEMFRTAVEEAMAESTTPVRWLVVAAEPVTDIDTTAADVVDTLQAELERAGVEFVFAELKGPVKDSLRRYGLFDRIGELRFYPTVGAAVDAYLEETGVEFDDWEERASGEDRR